MLRDWSWHVTSLPGISHRPITRCHHVRKGEGKGGRRLDKESELLSGGKGYICCEKQKEKFKHYMQSEGVKRVLGENTTFSGCKPSLLDKHDPFIWSRRGYHKRICVQRRVLPVSLYYRDKMWFKTGNVSRIKVACWCHPTTIWCAFRGGRGESRGNMWRSENVYVCMSLWTVDVVQTRWDSGSCNVKGRSEDEKWKMNKASKTSRGFSPL